jgi:hypothetical protein
MVTSPSLIIAQQHSLGQETVSQDGLERDVHVVVKNLAFTIILSLLPDNEVGLNTLKGHKLSAKLVYDAVPLRYVDFLHTEPLTYTSTTCEDGLSSRVEVKILVRYLTIGLMT